MKLSKHLKKIEEETKATISSALNQLDAAEVHLYSLLDPKTEYPYEMNMFTFKDAKEAREYLELNLSNLRHILKDFIEEEEEEEE